MTIDQYPWLIFNMVLLGAITFCYRYSFISSQGKKIAQRIPPQFLMLLGPAVFTSIIANNIFSYHDNPTEFQQKVLVATAALVVAYFTRNVVATMVFGLVLLHYLQN